MTQPLNAAEIERLLQPYLEADPAAPRALFGQLAVYLELLLKWNARTNLTAIRQPAEIVRRHFGESLFAARHLGACETLLDFGSGAGFPGLPIQLFRPDIPVTLAESQNKKATFLREAIRTLSLTTEVWAGRVEAMPSGRQFDVVTLRAVDDMELAVKAAAERSVGRLLLLTTSRHAGLELPGFAVAAAIAIPASQEQILLTLARQSDVPRGTLSE
jgi:16S rRNA (guanine527-N7)-methyltransferase